MKRQLIAAGQELRHISGMRHGYSRYMGRRARPLGALALAVFLAACGGSREPAPRIAVAEIDLQGANRFAEGPINTACTIHYRRTGKAQKCGCIQAAANRTLSQAQQQRAVRFFAEPELLQRIKLSDTPPDERFWEDWARFAETAEALCR